MKHALASAAVGLALLSAQSAGQGTVVAAETSQPAEIVWRYDTGG